MYYLEIQGLFKTSSQIQGLSNTVQTLFQTREGIPPHFLYDNLRDIKSKFSTYSFCQKIAAVYHSGHNLNDVFSQVHHTPHLQK